MRILCACEESQAVTIAFRNKGHEAYSCDILPCSGGHPEWHIQADVLSIISGGWFSTGTNIVVIDKWDIMIAHPPCTHLAVSGMRWFKEGCKGQKPLSLQIESLAFVKALMDAPIDKICIENPVSIISTKIRKPDQIINPFQFGHPEQKKTCLWLKRLPLLKETNNVYDYMMTLPIRERTRIHWLGSNHAKERSKTYTGIAEAFANQWG
jgi:hypothetical protein